MPPGNAGIQGSRSKPLCCLPHSLVPGTSKSSQYQTNGRLILAFLFFEIYLLVKTLQQYSEFLFK
jgi:hypothetical protein